MSMNFREGFEPVALKDTNVFKPIKVGNIELKHRIALAPLTRLRNTNNLPGQWSVEYYDQRSKYPGTLIITEGTLISPEYGSGPPNVPEISTDEQVEAWKPIHDKIHENGSYSFQQLWALGRQSYPQILKQRGLQFISASDGVYMDEETEKAAKEFGTPLHGLTKAEIKECVEHYVRAAKNSLKSGADGVELHSGNGYLLNQFIDPMSNKRTDEYGGSIENRARLTLEVLDALIDAVGPDKVGIRFSPWGTFGDMTGHKDPTIFAQYAYLIAEIENRARKGKKIAYIHLIEPRVPDMSYAEGEYTVPTGSNDFIYSIWNGTVIRAGDYALHPEQAKIDTEKHETLLAYGRMFISNPDLPKRLYEGQKLTQYGRGHFHSAEPYGYIDYPTYEEIEKNGFPQREKKEDGPGYTEALKAGQ